MNIELTDGVVLAYTEEGEITASIVLKVPLNARPEFETSLRLNNGDETIIKAGTLGDLLSTMRTEMYRKHPASMFISTESEVDSAFAEMKLDLSTRIYGEDTATSGDVYI